MKKYLSLFLAIVMVFAIAIPAFAADENSPFKIVKGEDTTYYDTLLDAVAAAEDGDTIEMLADYTMDGVTQNQVKITKAITIDGGNHTLTFNTATKDTGNDNVFPILVDASDKSVTIQNFAEITSSGGGITVGAGTLNLNGVTVVANGRAAVKTQNGSAAKAINIENSTIRMALDAGSSEATMILSGDQASTLTLGNGAIIEKPHAANGATSTQSAVIYMSNKGNHSIIMNAGSKVIAKQKSGTATTVIGLGDASTTGTNSVTINEGAYLVIETAVPTVNFFGPNASGNITLNVPANALLVKSDLTPTLPKFSSDINHGAKTYNYVEGTSAVDGYKAYNMVEEIVTDFNFDIIDGDNVTKYAGTLGQAISVATNGSTIKLLKNYEGTETNIAISGKSLTIDLNNFTANLTGGGYFINSLKSGLTIKNGTFKVARGIVVQAGGHLEFDNATAITSEGTGSNSRPLVKLNGSGVTKLTVRNSTLESKSQESNDGQALVLVERGTTGTIDLVGTSVLKFSGVLGKNNQNHTAVALQGTGTDLVLNVGAEASLIAAHASSTKEKIASVLADQTDGDITVNLEAGATIVADRTYADDNKSTTQFFLTIKPEGTMTINNNGANFVVSADVAKQGIALPANAFGYKIGDAKVTLAEGNVYQNAEATEAVTLTTVSYSFKPEMIAGAAMRLELPFGLRFGATISAEEYESILALDPNAEIGFVVAKKGDAGSNFDTIAMMESKYKFVPATSVVTADGTVTFETNIYIGEDSIIATADKDGFKTNVAAKAYIKATINGEAVYYFSDYKMSDNSRSLYKVAQSYVADTVDGSTENIVANYIIAVCEA